MILSEKDHYIALPKMREELTKFRFFSVARSTLGVFGPRQMTYFSSTPTANNRLEAETGQVKGLILQQILGYISSHRVSLSALLGDEVQKNTAARVLPWEAWALHEKVFWMILSFTENQAQHATSPPGVPLLSVIAFCEQIRGVRP